MIDQKGMFNNIYKNLVTPILKKDVGIDAEYLTNFSLSLLTFSSKKQKLALNFKNNKKFESRILCC